MKKNCYSILIAFCLFTVSCTQDDVPGNDINASTQLNVAYGGDPAQKADIYLPANRSTTSTKVMIMIHGGAWSAGDKADFSAFVDTLKRRLPGYAIFNLNYRLSNGTTNFFPTQENDIKSALSFIYTKRSEYQLSDKWVLLGASAGAHLALLQAYKYDMPLKVKAVVDFFGPSDMTDLYNNPASVLAPPAAVAAVVGGTPATLPTLYQQSSPLTFAGSQSPPTIILQGGVDVLVSPSQSVALWNKLQAAGAIQEYVFYPAENHGWTGPNLVDSFNKIVAFLNTHVN